MTRLLAAAALAVAAFSAAAQRPPPPSAADLVELDVVVLDRSDQPVTGLRLEDFKVKEDGHAVELKTFSAVTALGSLDSDDGRIVTLLMDDIGVPITGTSPMQQIAPIVLSPMGQGDELSVVRLVEPHRRSVRRHRHRARPHRRLSRPARCAFSFRDATETVLTAVAKISRQLEAIDHRRKVILCLGLPSVCDVSEPARGSASVIWPLWVAAINAAARANVSVYCVDPTGARGGFHVSSGGLVQMTGGRVFARQNNFVPAAESIWREAGHYYLLGYWPAASKREVRSIDVSVARKGVRVHARQRR